MKPYLNKNTTCCFSGYRPEKLPWGYHEDDPRCVRLRERLEDVASAVCASGISRFICGMALGSDMLFAEAVLLLKEEHPEVELEAALPCEDQAAKWSEAQRSRYFKLLSQCDVETYISRRYTPDCMMRRNMYMVDESSVLITVYDGRFGGTMQTVGYAETNGIEIIQLKP